MNKKEFKAWLKECDKDHKIRMNKIKQYDKESERLWIEFQINQYELLQANGTSWDEDEQKEQRRRKWKLLIMKRQEDDEFLKSLGLVHISKLKKNIKTIK